MTRTDSTTDEELVRRVLAGEPEVFAELYCRHFSRTRRLAYAMTGRHEVADDLAQEIFLRAYERLDSFRGDARFSTWLHRVAINHCLNFARRGRRDALGAPRDVDDEGAAGAPDATEERVMQKEIRTEIHRALLELAPHDRLVVVLRDVEGLSYQEIAERTGASMGTIASRLNRARGRLALKLAHLKGAL